MDKYPNHKPTSRIFYFLSYINGGNLTVLVCKHSMVKVPWISCRGSIYIIIRILWRFIFHNTSLRIDLKRGVGRSPCLGAVPIRDIYLFCYYGLYKLIGAIPNIPWICMSLNRHSIGNIISEAEAVVDWEITYVTIGKRGHCFPIFFSNLFKYYLLLCIITRIFSN